MSHLTDIAEKLQDTEATLRGLEAKVREFPDSPSLLVSIASIRKHRNRLEEEFARASGGVWQDVCNYRLFKTDGEQPLALAIGKSLVNFQEWVSVTHDALKSGPKRTARISAEAATTTAFGFGYSYAGSVGLVLTLPNERVLADESDLDRTIRTVLEMAKATSSDQIAAYARDLGPAVITKLYRWVKDHVQAGLGADIDWRKDSEVKASLFVEPATLDNLKRAIEETSDETRERFTVVGDLVGTDVPGHWFHMQFEHGEDIEGHMAENIGLDSTVTLPRRYRATIERATRLNYATEKEDISYFLVSLEEVPGHLATTSEPVVIVAAEGPLLQTLKLPGVDDGG